MEAAHNLFASIREEQVRVDDLKHAVQSKGNLLRYKRAELKELEDQMVAIEETQYTLRNTYGRAAERQNSLERYLRDEKEKQYSILIQLQSAEDQPEDIDTLHDEMVKQARNKCKSWMELLSYHFKKRKPFPLETFSKDQYPTSNVE